MAGRSCGFFHDFSSWLAARILSDSNRKRISCPPSGSWCDSAVTSSCWRSFGTAGTVLLHPTALLRPCWSTPVPARKCWTAASKQSVIKNDFPPKKHRRFRSWGRNKQTALSQIMCFFTRSRFIDEKLFPSSAEFTFLCRRVFQTRTFLLGSFEAEKYLRDIWGKGWLPVGADWDVSREKNYFWDNFESSMQSLVRRFKVNLYLSRP